MTRNCAVCDKQFTTYPSLLKIGKGKYCSKACSNSVTLFRPGEEHRLGGDKHPLWKGESVSYTGLHIWVRQRLGTPKVCEHCGTTTAKRFEWANISQEYKRDLSDWLRLCKKCHNSYDNVGNRAATTKRERYGDDFFHKMGHKGGTQKSINWRKANNEEDLNVNLPRA